MSARTSLAVGFVISGVLGFGCAALHQSSIPAQPPSAPAQSSTNDARSAAAQSSSPAAPIPAPDADDASLLARKTSEYAQHMAPLLGQGASPATRRSIVQWVEPSKHPANPDHAQADDQAPVANRPVALAAERLKEDTSLPQILPESADQIPPASHDNIPASVAVSTDEYELKLEKLVHDYPRDLGNQLDYQLLRFVRDEPTPNLSDVAQLSSEDRDILLALMDGLNNFRAAAHGDGNLMLNRKIQPLLEMADRLRSEAQLAVPTVAFCSQVTGYGVYRPMASSRFPASRDNNLIVYCEAANFTSVQGSDRIWRTRLKQEMILYTDTGLAVWPDKSNLATFVDQSRNRRHDFFISRRVMLPSSLAAGKYVMKITLTDEESNRVVEAGSPLEIIAAAPAASAATAGDRIEPSLPALTP
jgi:hypothetical protein